MCYQIAATFLSSSNFCKRLSLVALCSQKHTTRRILEDEFPPSQWVQHKAITGSHHKTTISLTSSLTLNEKNL